MYFNDNIFQSFTEELRFLVEAISLDRNVQQGITSRFYKEGFDSIALLSMAERHRVLPLLYKEIQKISPELFSKLPQEFSFKTTEQVNRSLSLAGEGIMLSEQFRQSSIPVVFIKGFMLSLQLYNDIAVRPSRDIDILIYPKDFNNVNQILINNGYAMNYPSQLVSARQMSYHQKFKHEASYWNKQKGILLEVHWRLLSYSIPPQMPVEKIMESSQEIVVANHPIRVMNDSDNFRYLCDHGAWHQWYRLLWLRDIAQFIEQKEDMIAEHLKILYSTKSERPALQALLLSNKFFGSKLFDNIDQRITPTVRSLAAWSVQSIEADEKSIQARGFSRIKGSFQRMKFHPNLIYKIKCWSILQPNADDWTLVRLPDFFFFLYYPLRPFLWFYSVYLKKTNHLKRK